MFKRHTHVNTPWLTVLADQANKRVDLGSSDVFLQQFSVVMEQSSDRVLGKDIVANLFLHEAKLLGYVLLQGDRQTDRQNEQLQQKTDSLCEKKCHY